MIIRDLVTMNFGLLSARRRRFEQQLPTAIQAFAKYYGLDPAILPPARIIFRSMTFREIKEVIRTANKWAPNSEMPSDAKIRALTILSDLQSSYGIAYHVSLSPNIHIPTRYTQLFLPDFAIVLILAHEYAHVVQNGTRLPIIANVSSAYSPAQTAAAEGLASRLNTTIMEEMEKTDKISWKERLIGKVYQYGLKILSTFVAPVKTLQNIVRPIIRRFIPDQRVGELVDDHPRIFGFLIDPYKDGNRFVKKVEELLEDRKRAFDMISYQPPLNASELFDPEGYVRFYLAHIEPHRIKNPYETVLATGQMAIC